MVRYCPQGKMTNDMQIPQASGLQFRGCRFLCFSHIRMVTNVRRNSRTNRKYWQFGKKQAYRSFRVFFRGFLWHIPNCIMLYINTLKHVAISRQTSSKLLNHRNKLIFTVVTAILAPEMTYTPKSFFVNSQATLQYSSSESLTENKKLCESIFE